VCTFIDPTESNLIKSKHFKNGFARARYTPAIIVCLRARITLYTAYCRVRLPRAIERAKHEISLAYFYFFVVILRRYVCARARAPVRSRVYYLTLEIKSKTLWRAWVMYPNNNYHCIVPDLNPIMSVAVEINCFPPWRNIISFNASFSLSAYETAAVPLLLYCLLRLYKSSNFVVSSSQLNIVLSRPKQWYNDWT